MNAESRLAEVRKYVESNRDVWKEEVAGSPGYLLAMAYADIFQKVLNVIDTGNPMVEKAAS